MCTKLAHALARVNDLREVNINGRVDLDSRLEAGGVFKGGRSGGGRGRGGILTDGDSGSDGGSDSRDGVIAGGLGGGGHGVGLAGGLLEGVGDHGNGDLLLGLIAGTLANVELGGLSVDDIDVGAVDGIAAKMFSFALKARPDTQILTIGSPRRRQQGRERSPHTRQTRWKHRRRVECKRGAS